MGKRESLAYLTADSDGIKTQRATTTINNFTLNNNPWIIIRDDTAFHGRVVEKQYKNPRRIDPLNIYPKQYLSTPHGTPPNVTSVRKGSSRKRGLLIGFVFAALVLALIGLTVAYVREVKSNEKAEITKPITTTLNIPSTKSSTLQFTTSKLTTPLFTTVGSTTRPETTQGQITQPEMTKVATEKPTTQLVTTEGLTTQLVTTKGPRTQPVTTGPTTQPVTTEGPTTQPATTQPVTTEGPTTQPATTNAPTTQPVTTDTPTSQPVTTEGPTTQPVTTDAPTTQLVTTEGATTQPVSTEGPTTQLITTEGPTTQLVTTVGPITKSVTTEGPTTQLVTTEGPTTQPVTTEGPTTQPVTTEGPTTQPATTNAPTTQPVTTEGPTTQLVTTEGPTTQPVTTEGPTTQPVTTEGPTTQPVTTEGPTTQLVTTEGPTTQPVTTEGPTTQSFTTEEQTTTLPISFPGNWTEWSEWGGCVVNDCGHGYNHRTRTCISTDPPCIGTHTQVQPCYVTCNHPVYKEWTSWGPWTPCTVSCGGGQRYRQRLCTDPTPGTMCQGLDFQGRPCNEFNCSGCDCPIGGTIDIDCSICSCAGQKMTGTVYFDFNGIKFPLLGVEIRNLDRPSIILAITDERGGYVVDDICASINYIFSLTNYLSEVVPGIDGSVDVILEQKEPLTMIQHPEVKYRVVGDDVTLCCDATSNYQDPYDYAEWYRNGQIVDVTRIEYPNQLVLNNLQETNAGNYSCRLVNENTVADSLIATITVKNQGSFCPQFPASSIVSLPTGCLFDGLSEIDIGQCIGGPCRETTIDDGLCREYTTSCCIAGTTDTLNILCEDSSVVSYDVITSCMCGTC